MHEPWNKYICGKIKNDMILYQQSVKHTVLILPHIKTNYKQTKEKKNSKKKHTKKIMLQFILNYSKKFIKTILQKRGRESIFWKDNFYSLQFVSTPHAQESVSIKFQNQTKHNLT